MTYTKPELVALSHAVEAVQKTGNKLGVQDDGPPEGDTEPAYEADE